MMELRPASELDLYERVFLLLATVLAGLHLYLGLFAPFVAPDRATQFVIIGLILLFGPLVYFTPYWRPLLYLLGAGLAAYLGAVWVLSGMEYLLFGMLAGITAMCFILLAIYLFFREENPTTRVGK